MHSSAKKPKRLLSLALGLGLATAALGTAVPASAQTPVPDAGQRQGYAQGSGEYAGSGESAQANRAFFEAVLKSVVEKRAAHPGLKTVTVTYDPSGAPSFASQIAGAAQIWNSAVSHVKLQASAGGGDFAYYEGDDPRGSYASTDGHGGGYIFLDHAQNQQYDSVRVTTHETGHVLGLPDHYEGPCSELMSGGGPGPSCTNSQPDANERAQVDQLWVNGLKKAVAEVRAAHPAH
ncbi:snapalysin [Streptomyces sp. NPDC058045]|uniref:snapalysin n=1 Tax=Streptomyces sp. NPDC058045 TaxID=3346311 RepID=UPI0036E62DF3